MEEWKKELWNSFRKLQKSEMMKAREAGFRSEAQQLAEANRRIDEMSNVELIDALT